MQQTTQADDLTMNLVEQVMARPQIERQAFLQNACRGDPELYERAWKYVQWEERMGGFLLDPFYPPVHHERPFEPGQLLINRFRMIREVARGGMGIVWEAMDEKLDRQVAIKSAKTGFAKQLPPEVRNAREISHPNVCKLFEIHTASGPGGEIDFISMEFLEGETLAERLGRGPIPKKESLHIALQLCAGLSEAHRHGVIHGDLKSGNVILANEPDGSVRAVIMDFGLASSQRPSKKTSSASALGGTPAYMAPELWKGVKPSVASDIYALGVVLWELVSGLRPSDLGVTSSTLSWDERPSWKPPTGYGKWDRILTRCLQADPARRFQGAEAVAAALGPPRAKRWLVTAALVTAFAVISGLLTYQRATAPAESVRLAILPFASGASPDPQVSSVMNEVADSVARLQGNRHTSLHVIPFKNSLRQHVASVAKASSALGATHVLHGRLEKRNKQLKLLAVVTDARSGADLKEWSALYSAAEARYVPVVLASMVTDTFHLPPLADARAISAAAGPDYVSGVAFLQHGTTVPAAISAFERAVHANPDSPLAFAGLAEAQWMRYSQTSQQIWRDRALESTAQAERRNQDLAPVHRVVGIRLADVGFYEQAAAAYRRGIELDPGDAESYRRLGEVYEDNNEAGQALVAFETAVSLRPNDYRAQQELGSFYFNRGDYAQAIILSKKAVQLAPGEPAPRFALGSTYLDMGKFVDAEQQLRLAVAVDEAPRSLYALGLTLMYQGRDSDAITYFTRALQLDPQNDYSWLYLGIAYRRTHRLLESAEANRHGRDLADTEMARNPRDGVVRSHLGYFAAVLGDRGRAESETAQALRLKPDDAETLSVAILTDEVLGKRDATLALLQRSSRQQLLDLSRWPDLADLHRDSRFIQMLDTLKLR